MHGTAENKYKRKTTARIIQQRAEKENYQTWVTKYILLTLLYAEPKTKRKTCEYQEQNKLKQTTVK